MPYIPQKNRAVLNTAVEGLARAIISEVKESGELLSVAGMLNYALTRLLQEIPKDLQSSGITDEEIRYWMTPLFLGVLQDVGLEHKRRVNAPYEVAQQIKNGDAYNTPYYTKPIAICDQTGTVIGHVEVHMARDDESLGERTLTGRIMTQGLWHQRSSA